MLTSHLVGYDLLTVSKKVWDEMGADKQAKFQAAADAAIAFSTEKHLAREQELVAKFKAGGLKIYEPDTNAFRTHVQEKCPTSDFAKSWPAGMVDNPNRRPMLAAGSSCFEAWRSLETSRCCNNCVPWPDCSSVRREPHRNYDRRDVRPLPAAGCLSLHP